MRGPAPAPDSLPPSPLVPLGGSVIDSFLLFDTDHDGVISKDDTKMAFRRSSFSNASTGHKVGCGRWEARSASFRACALWPRVATRSLLGRLG